MRAGCRLLVPPARLAGTPSLSDFNGMKKYSFLAAMLLIAGCSAVPPAEMRLPPALAGQPRQTLPIEGLGGGGDKGRFYIGPWQGSFTRSEDRLAVFDALVTNRGHAGFVMEGPEISWTIEADCRMRERVVEVGAVSFTPAPMSYACRFTADGQAFPARFELHEVKTGFADNLSRRQRRGEIALGGEVVQISSVHKIAGSPLELASPIGYVFEQAGQPVGAVEINGRPRLILTDPSDKGLARTLTIAGLALALLRDPANSPLEG